MEKLPSGNFLRVHKSYIVNKKKISRFDSAELEIDTVTLPIGSIYREALMQEMRG
jgi:DNA-binding LytR/AlgR family response regulator